MKKIIYYFLILAALFIAGCKKFLTATSTDTTTTQNYYQTANQLNAALTNIYGTMMSYAYGKTGNSLSNTLNYSDEVVFNYGVTLNGADQQCAAYAYDYSNSIIGNLWNALYSSIASANLLQANINNAAATTSVDTRNYILAQALFLRGYAYYLLGSRWGGVPIRTSATNIDSLNLKRSSLTDTYLQAVADIEAAIPYLKTPSATGTPSRISQTAAEGILTRVFLTMASPGPNGLNQTKYYDSTIYYANLVINSGLHSLYTAKQGVTTPDSSYAYIFINEARQLANTQECMWEATFSGNDNTSTYTFDGVQGFQGGIYFSGSSNDASIGYAYGYSRAPRPHWLLYGTGDLRRDWNIAPYYYTGKATNPNESSAGIIKSNFPVSHAYYWYARYEGKWRREFETYTPKSKYGSPESFPILRYSDVLLMLAEAELQSPNGNKSDALEKVNMVRRRAYGVDINTANPISDLTSLSMNDIMDERERELCYEGVRWVDIRRWGVYLSKMGNLVQQMIADGITSTTPTLTIGGRGANINDYLLFTSNAASSDKFELLPIPASEMSTNSLATQNPGW